jgi:hypothetical protein
MSIETVVTISLGLGAVFFTLKDWEKIEIDWEKKTLTIQRRTNLLPPAN